MADYREQKERAVSPVVGVMLMLVVTVIIAAVVSAFSGNMMTGGDDTPKATITGTYSQTKGLAMTHAGGDGLFTADLIILVRLSDEFGYGQSEYGAKNLNMSTITDTKGNYWINKNGVYGVTSWRPGDTMFIRGMCADLALSGLLDDGFKDLEPCYNDNLYMASGGRNFCFIDSINNQFNIGKAITLEVYQKGGKMISSYDMIIEP